MVHYTPEQILASSYEYVPNLAANATAITLFSLILLCQIVFGVYTRQWWFLVTWTIGNGLEVLGYAGRIVSHGDLFNRSMYMMQLVGTILAPAFTSAGIYYLLAKVITVYGEKYSPLAPMRYSAIFIGFDLFSILIQAAGGGTATSSDENTSRVGSWITVAGIAVQVFSISVFMALASRVIYNVWEARTDPDRNYDPAWAHIRSRPLFIYMIPGMLIALLFIFIRSVYRLVELGEGWNGYLMTHERYFLVLDGLMIFFSEIMLTVIHPGFSLGRDPIPVRGLHYKTKAVKDELPDDPWSPIEDKTHSVGSSGTTKVESNDTSESVVKYTVIIGE